MRVPVPRFKSLADFCRAKRLCQTHYFSDAERDDFCRRLLRHIRSHQIDINPHQIDISCLRTVRWALPTFRKTVPD